MQRKPLPFAFPLTRDPYDPKHMLWLAFDTADGMNMPTPCSHEDILRRLNYPLEWIPKEFCDAIELDTVMDIPLMLDEADPKKYEHLIDFKTWENYRKTQKTATILHPFTREPVNLKQIKKLPELQREIRRFIIDEPPLLALTAAERVKKQSEWIENKIGKFSEERMPKSAEVKTFIFISNIERIEYFSIPKNLIPEEFLAPATREIMTFPVMIDNKKKWRIDYKDLTEWWEKNNKYYFNPYTRQPIQTLRFCDLLFHRMNDFMDGVELKIVKERVDNVILESKRYRTTKRSHEILIEQEIAPKYVPEQFILFNFEGRIMTHPVCLDGRYTLDLEPLLAYWNEEDEQHVKKNLYVNYFTGERIRSITYDHVLKRRIDIFTTNAKIAEMGPQPKAYQGDLYHAPKLPTIFDALSGRNTMLFFNRASRITQARQQIAAPAPSLSKNREE